MALEEVAFSSIGTTFCGTVMRFAPVIVSMGGNRHFQNLLRLLHIWERRIDQQNLLEQQQELAGKLSRVQEIEFKPLCT